MPTEKESSAWVATHATWLSAFVRGLTRGEADAEDAFQEVWLRVMKGPDLSGIASPRAYLARIARSVVIDRYRRDGRYEVTLDAVDETGGTMAGALVDERPTPAQRTESALTHDAVLSAVKALPTGPREVVLLRIEGELTFQEIADELKIPLGTALTWMRTATEQLKKRLGR